MRKNPVLKLLAMIGLCYILNIELAYSQDTPNHFFPVRPLGIGNAFTAVANDENAIWMNPAGIARIRKARSRKKFHLSQLPNLGIGGNSDASSIYSGLEQQSSGGKDASAIIDQSSNLGEDPLWVMAQIWPIMMFDFGNMPTAFGAYSNTRAVINIDSDDSTLAHTEFITDVGGVMSFAFTNKTNRFSSGFTVRSISRYAFENTLTVATLIDKEAMQDLVNDEANQSSAVAVDWGTIFTFADFWYPTIGVSILNLPLGCKENYLNPFSKLRETVCGTVFTGDFSNEDATSTVDPTDIRFGFSIAPRITRKVGLRLAADLHHYTIKLPTRTTDYQKFHSQK